MSAKLPLYIRFWSKVHISDGCWEWKGCRSYGSISVEGKVRRAPRVMWYLRHGSWPKLDILHSCDNPPCVNPAHLSEGTKKENAQQAVERKRNFETRKTICKNGHPYSPDNTTICGRKRYCKACQRDKWAVRYPDATPRGPK
jgi:hypothetical protein